MNALMPLARDTPPQTIGLQMSRQVSWLSVHHPAPAFPEKLQWHGLAQDSPITVAGAAPEFERARSSPDSLLARLALERGSGDRDASGHHAMRPRRDFQMTHC